MKCVTQKVDGVVKKVGLVLESQAEIDKLGAIFNTQKIAHALVLNYKQINSIGKLWNVDGVINWRDKLYKVL